MEEIKHYKCKKCGNDKAINVLPGDSCKCGGQEWEYYKTTPANREISGRNSDGTFIKGVSGNPSGRPKDTLKEYLRKKFTGMTDEEKEEFLKKVSAEVQFKMAEGNPDTQSEVKVEGRVMYLPSEVMDKNDINAVSPNPETSSEGQPQV